MATDTTNYLLKKPTVGGDDDLWGGYINDNMDTIDTQMKSNDDAAAAAQSTADTANTTANAALPKAGGTMTGDIAMGDNVKAKFGTSDDLQIYHSGTASHIKDTGTGNLYIDAANSINLRSAVDNEDMIKGVINAQVELYHNGIKKLATTSTGVDVTGTITADDVTASYITNGVASGTMNIGGGAAQNTGGNVIFYGEAHAQTGDILLRSGTKYIGRFTSGGDFRLYDDSAGSSAAKFFWDASAECLGIGTTSPQSELHISGASTPELRLTDTTNSVEANFYTNDSIGSIGTKSSHALAFTTGNTERARIDSSGNLLVGTTNAYPTTFTTGSGIAIRGDGLLSLANDSENAIDLNRTGTDGNLINFYKNGVGSGSIQTNGGYLRFVSGSPTYGSGLSFGNQAVYPLNSVGSGTNGVMDFGDANNRFKDLYLSGGVYLGGTGAANKLDDYEEGSFTPTCPHLTLSSATGSYTKVGRIVTISGHVTFPSSGSGTAVRLEGLPFTNLTGAQYRGGGNIGWQNDSTNDMTMLVGNGTTSFSIYYGGSGVSYSEMSTRSMYFSAVYYTAS